MGTIVDYGLMTGVDYGGRRGWSAGWACRDFILPNAAVVVKDVGFFCVREEYFLASFCEVKNRYKLVSSCLVVVQVFHAEYCDVLRKFKSLAPMFFKWRGLKCHS